MRYFYIKEFDQLLNELRLREVKKESEKLFISLANRLVHFLVLQCCCMMCFTVLLHDVFYSAVA